MEASPHTESRLLDAGPPKQQLRTKGEGKEDEATRGTETVEGVEEEEDSPESFEALSHKTPTLLELAEKIPLAHTSHQDKKKGNKSKKGRRK